MKMRILIADDDQACRQLLCVTLHAHDPTHDIIVVGDGEEAIEKAERDRPDIILMDVMMPPDPCGGFMALEYLKASEATAEIPVVLMSGVFTRQEYIKRGLDLGAVDYLMKPFDDIVGLPKRLEGYVTKKKVRDGPGLTYNKNPNLHHNRKELKDVA